MTNKVIDLPVAQSILKAAVNERGESHVYLDDDDHLALGGQCRYWLNKKGVPGCIVGVGLHILRFANADDLQHMDSQDDSSIAMVCMPEGVEITSKARLYLGEAQFQQDQGETWGEALSAAEASLNSNNSAVKDEYDYDDQYELNSLYGDDL